MPTLRLSALLLSATLLTGCELAGPADEPLVFMKLAVGHQMTCGLTTEGEAYCWGADVRVRGGLTGDSDRPVPVQTTQRFFDISTGANHACALAADSTAYCWGRDYTDAIYLSPTQRSTIKFKSINVGGYGVSVCGVTAAGAAYCMGQNEYGQAGVGHTAPVLGMSPVQTGAVALRLEAAYHGCLLTSAGAVQCWGYNGQGSLGLADTALTCDPVPSCAFPLPATVPTGALSFVKLSVGGATTCALTGTGAAWCWGSNYDGEVGAPPADTCIPIIPCNPRPIAVSGGLSFREISTRWGHTCAISMSGQGYCWGENEEGPLGTGDLVDRAAPTAILGGLEFQQIESGTRHTCGLTTAGAAYCWGNNIAGSLGIGTFEVRRFTRPQRVRGP